MSEPNGFHAGEIAVQIRAGERAIAERRESTIRDRLNDAANAFLESQTVVAAGALAPDGALWASMWSGAKGFLRGTATGDSVEVLHPLDDHVADPVRSIVRSNAPLGMLVIDLETRRRLRINGVVGRVNDSGLALHIREAFGNCPKYIQKRLRSHVGVSANRAIASAEHGTMFDEQRRSLIARADTLFVASVHPERGIDASHRGGPPGFARVVDDRTIRIPDYAGNSMFQTLGNLEVDARAGLAFIDFDRHRVLSATGHAASDFGEEDPAHPTGGTDRYWSFTVDRWVERSLSSATTWLLVERSPFNPR
jgi:uncharacterized protein